MTPVQQRCRILQSRAGEMLVAYDELDLPPGSCAAEGRRRPGGHNGMRDMIAQLGPDFWRLRLGIGHPGDRDKVLSYVLGRPPAEEDILIRQSIDAAADIMPMMLRDGPQQAMHRLHTTVARPA